MKKNSIPAVVMLLFLLMIALSACTSNGKQGAEESSQTEADSQEQELSLCFRRVSGNTSRDTALVHFIIKGKKVDGSYSDAIYEKDARKGTLKGTMKNNFIHTVWTFMQEGTTDTLATEFKLMSGMILMKPYSFDAKTGRQFTADTSDYTVIFKPIDCSISN